MSFIRGYIHTICIQQDLDKGGVDSLAGLESQKWGFKTFSLSVTPPAKTFNLVRLSIRLLNISTTNCKAPHRNAPLFLK